MKQNGSILDKASQDFLFILKQYIFPLLPVCGEEKLVIEKTENINAYLSIEKNTLCLYPAKPTSPFHVQIKFSFNSISLKSAESILSEIMNVSQFSYSKGEIYKIKHFDRSICDKYVYRTNRYDLAFKI